MNPSSNGASNAQDFQPQTQNPQSNVVPPLQQPGSLQTPAASDVLTQANTGIIVPGGGLVAGATTSSASETTVKRHDSTGVFFVLGLLVVLVAIGLVFKRRKKAPAVEPIPAPVQSSGSPQKSASKKSTKKHKHKRKKK